MIKSLSFRRIAVLPVVALVSIFLIGCSAFQSSRQIDMNPFAENTSLMFAEAAKVGRPAKFDYLKQYEKLPEIQLMRVKAQPLIKGLRAIVMYSNQLVALNMSAKSDREKNRFLKAYFKEAEAKIADRSRYDSIGVTSSMMDSVYANIERAETFREGIEAASPTVNAIVLAMLQLLDEIDASVPVVIKAMDQQIETDYAAKRENYANLVRLQTQYHQAATLVYDGRTGNRDAFGKLFEVDPSMREIFTSADKPSSKEFDAAESSIAIRLDRIEKYLRQLDNEKAAYTGKQKELEDLRVNVDGRLKIARDAIVVWAQSHRNLGAGIAVPPLIDVAGIAGGLARKVVPLP